MIFWKFVKRNIRRTPYQAMAATMVMFLTFLVLSIFLLVASGSQKILTHFENKPQVVAFFKLGYNEEDITALKDALIKTGRVSSVDYISQDDALKKYQEDNKNDPLLLQLVSANILPAAFEISTKSPQDLDVVAQILRKEPAVDNVGYPVDVVEKINEATKFIRTGGAILVGFLIIFSTLMILMIIGFKMRLRRYEIETMRLLGASSWFIRLPFLFEGMIYGVTGAILAWAMSYILLWYFNPWLENYLLEFKILPVPPLFMLELLGIEIVVALIIGLLGSMGAVRRYLHL